MAKSKAIEELLQEHDVILKVVRAVSGMGEAIGKHRLVDLNLLREAVGFMSRFVDDCHHAKEEDLLFPALVSAGLAAQAGPVAQLKFEHSQVRDWTVKLATAVDALDRQESGSERKVIQAIAFLTELYALHITKENDVLFPMAEKLLTPERLQELSDEFEGTRRNLDQRERDRWVAIADSLLAA